MSLVEQFSNEGFWQPGDADWMKERKALWREVKKSLDIMARSQPKLRKGMNHHKSLFFTGKLDSNIKSDFSFDNTADYCRGRESFDSFLPLFVAWYHPNPDQIDWNSYWVETLAKYNLPSARFTFFTRYVDSTRLPTRKTLYSPVYGMAGGRELFWIKLLYNGLNYRENYPKGSTKKYVKCNSPAGTCRHFLKGVAHELCMDARYFPNSPGQFLWPQFVYSMEKYPDEIHLKDGAEGVDFELRNKTMTVLREILRFSDRTDRSRNRPETQALVDTMAKPYERRDLPDSLLKLWDEAKDYKPDSNIYSTEFDIGEAWFEQCNVLTVEEQQVRIDQWKQA